MTDERNGGRHAAIVTWTSLATAGTIGVTIVTAALMILNWLYTENNRMRSDVTAVQISIAKEAVTKSEFKAGMQELSERFDRGLDRIEKRLDARTK